MVQSKSFVLLEEHLILHYIVLDYSLKVLINITSYKTENTFSCQKLSLLLEDPSKWLLPPTSVAW